VSPRFTSRQRVGFALWFCLHDLLEPVARPVSRAVITAVALSTAASCVALALPWVTAEIRLRRLAASPWARCVWVWGHTELDEKFTPARLGQLASAVREKLPAADAGVAAAGFHDVTLEFIDPAGVRRYRRGRTIGRDDPLLPALGRLLRWGAGFDGPDSSGIILAPALVERLGESPDYPPAMVSIATVNGRPQAVTVAGITRDSFPLEYDFLLTEAGDEHIRAADNAPPPMQVWSGPLGADWPKKWSRFPEVVKKKAAAEWQIEVKEDDRLAGRVLRLGAADARPEELWRSYLVRINERMVELGLGDAPGFDAVEADPPASPPPPRPRGPYRKATVYVLDLKNLRPAADAARGMDLYANDAARALVDEIETTADQAKAVVVGLVATFCVAGFVALGLALFLRGRQKAAQVGMLRAMGADARMLRMTTVTEAAVLWAEGTVLGLGMACLIGIGLCRKYEVTWDELRAAARTGWWAVFVGVFLAASLCGSTLGNLLATRRVRRRPAAESLGLTS
jgi:hypothetical protein